MPKVPSRSVSSRLGVLLAAAMCCSADFAQAQLPPPEVESAPSKSALPIPVVPLSPAPAPAPATSVQSSPVPTMPAPAANVQPGEQVFQVVAPQTKISLRNLDTRVLELGNRIKIVDGFDQDKITVKALSPHRVRMHAENPGVTTLKLIDEFDNIHVIDVFVEPDTRELEAYLSRLFPGSSIDVVGIRDGVVLRGWVTEPAQIPQIMAIAEQFYEIVHPQLTVAGPSQVQLHVKVMEVQRSKIRQLGFNFLMTGNGYYFHNGVGALAPIGGLAATSGGMGPAGLIAPPPLTPTILTSALQNSTMQFAIAGNNSLFQGFLDALQAESLAKILAEPILVTTSGRPAKVHSGGEFPVLVPQSFGNLSIQWREFGVQLEAVPIVLGQGRLRLDLAPEVSERDFSNSVSINGMIVPGITSRSVNTQVEMRFGETLMIGGLISSRDQGTTQRVPFLGELPWIGAAFSRKSYTIGETELIILVTPQMVSPMAPHQVPPGGPGASSTVPIDRELYIDGNLEVPRFGPDCPDCQPSGALIMPSGALPTVPEACEPVPAATTILPMGSASSTKTPPKGSAALANSLSNTGSQTAASGHSSLGATISSETGSRTTVINPFQAAAKPAIPEPAVKPVVPKTPSTGIQQASATVTPSKPGESKVRNSIFESRSLPGLIQPKSPGTENAE